MKLWRAVGRRTPIALAALIACVASLAIPAAADPSERLEEIQRKKAHAQERQDQLDAKRDSILGRIAVLDEKRQAVETELSTLDEKLDVLDTRISQVADRLSIAQRKLTLLTDDLQQLLRRLDTRTELFTERAVAAYIAGPTAFADSILSSESFGELIDRYAYYEAALDSDSALVGEIEVLRDETEVRRDVIDEQAQEIASAKRALEADRTELAFARARRAEVLAEREAVLSDKQTILAKVEADKARYRAIEERLERESQEIQSILSQGSSSSGPFPTGGGQLLWPAAGPLTSSYGYRTHPIFGDQRLHTGIDIGAPYGAPVIAADAGVVSYAGAMSGYGNVIVVDHGGGLATTYNHLSAFSVGSGQSVGRGARIGSVGCTGYCTGPHLHFEVRVNGSPVDPMPYLQ